MGSSHPLHSTAPQTSRSILVSIPEHHLQTKCDQGQIFPSAISSLPLHSQASASYTAVPRWALHTSCNDTGNHASSPYSSKNIHVASARSNDIFQHPPGPMREMEVYLDL